MSGASARPTEAVRIRHRIQRGREQADDVGLRDKVVSSLRFPSTITFSASFST
jgi:hypothetical protein